MKKKTVLAIGLLFSDAYQLMFAIACFIVSLSRAVWIEDYISRRYVSSR